MPFFPTIGSFAQRVYNSIFPLTSKDPANGYALAAYVGGLGAAYQDVEDLAATGPNGEIGWSALVDVERVPDIGIPYLGQYVGVQSVGTDPPATQRQKVRDRAGWMRGSPTAIVDAVEATLTGGKHVKFNERDTGSAWHHNVQTRTGETPSAAAVLAAIASQKPAGQIITHSMIAGQDYADLKANHVNYANVKSSYADYNAVNTGP